MQKLVNFFNDITTRYSFYFVGIQGICTWIFIFSTIMFTGWIFGGTNPNGGGIIFAILTVLFYVTIAFAYAIYSLLITIKLVKKERINPQFRIENNFIKKPITRIIATILFIFGSLTWIGYMITYFHTILTIEMTLGTLKSFYIPIIILLIGYYIYKNRNKFFEKNIWSKILFYTIEIILLAGLLCIYDTSDVLLYPAIPYTILLHWIYEKINKFIESNGG